MIYGFFDDSGKESGQQTTFVTLAGYVARVDSWMPFVVEWDNLLLFHKLPNLHMKSIMTEGYAKKRDWDWKKRHAVLMDFVDLVKKHRLAGFAIGIEAAAWRDLPKATTSRVGNVQQFVFQRILKAVAEKLDAIRIKEDVQVIFDRDWDFCGTRLNLFAHALANHKWAERYALIGFSDASHMAGLQAADLLAYEARISLSRSLEKKSMTPRFDALIGTKELEDLYTVEFWYKHNIDALIPQIQKASDSIPGAKISAE